MKRLCCSLFALLAGCGAANAYTFSWDVASPALTNPIYGYNLSAGGTAQDAFLKWGIGSIRNPGKQSAYTFNGLDGSLDIGVGETKQFQFATFTHSNWDLTKRTEPGGAIAGATLDFDLTVGGLGFNPVFVIKHNETLNTNVPVCCDDTVTAPAVDLGKFTKNGLTWAVYLTALNLVSKEQQENVVKWYGNVKLIDVADVPVPPALALFGSGLVGIRLLARKKRKTFS